MTAIFTKGGNKLSGEIIISGSKNAALPIIAATILTDEDIVLSNVPNLSDIHYMLELIKPHGKDYVFKNNTLTIINSPKKSIQFEDLIFNKIRASSLMLGPILVKHHHAITKTPGGCAIGARPIDMHLSALEKMGADIYVSNGIITATTLSGLIGTEINFDKVSVGATQNIMMAATLAKGTTIINNAAIEPEVIDLANFLIQIGAKIEGIGEKQLIIQGVKQLGKCRYSIIPDRIEAGTYLIAVAAIGGKITLKNCVHEHLDDVLLHLEKTKSVKITCASNEITVEKINCISPVNISTESYPGFPTDLQPQFMTLMCLANGISVVNENIFEKRFHHISELQKLGCKIDFVNDKTVKITGKNKLFGSCVLATDLRAGAALIIATLSAQGNSIIENAYHINRGYENIVEKLTNCNATIREEYLDSSSEEKDFAALPQVSVSF